jgi:hypothetical protein
MSASFFGALTGILIQQISNKSEMNYRHLRNNLLQRVNRRICADNKDIKHAIEKMPNDFDPIVSPGLVHNILESMNSHLSSPKKARKRGRIKE